LRGSRFLTLKFSFAMAILVEDIGSADDYARGAAVGLRQVSAAADEGDWDVASISGSRP